MVGIAVTFGSGRSEEISAVKNGLKQPLVEKAIWVPIATSWFEKWEKYVSYEGPDREVHRPGPLDNSNLKGTYGDELRRGMIEGQDYILLPKNVGDMLINKYGGGPMFPRQVLRGEGVVGNTTGSFSLYVSLYPTRIEVYHCTRDHKHPKKDQNSNFMIRYFNGNLTLDRAMKDLQNKFGINEVTTSVRCWIKEHEEKITSIMRKENDANDEARIRYLTADLVEWDTDWKLYPPTMYNTGIKEILGTKNDCIEMILETYPSSFAPKEHLWPRFMMLQQWKDWIRVGDYIDCQLSAVQEAKWSINRSSNSRSSWYEGKVVSIEIENDKQKKITVSIIHPNCRCDTDSVVYTFPANYDQVNPLHKETPDRTLWREDEELDVYVSSSSSDVDGTWLIGTIKKKEGERLQVTYRKPAESTALTAATAANDIEVIDDDALKKSRGVAIGSSLNDIDDDESASASNNLTTEWLELYDPRLASLNSYTVAVVAAPAYKYGTSLHSTNSYGYGYGYHNYSTFDRHTAGKPEVPGAVGLQNLGNTCFLNSILQCLSNTRPITDFFLHTDYKSLINYDNPLGTGGKVVKAYGQLLSDIWSGSYIKAVPREVKHIIGELHPSFSGYEQQDAQECLSFLIDAMHEDCNQVKKKPFVQKIESNGRPDALISAESWRRFLLRNDSFIIDKCFGQLRSHVTCTNCSKESITFDEYSTLSLPIPLNTKKDVEVLVQLIGTLQPIRVVLQVELTQSMKDFRFLLVQKLKDCGVISEPENSTSASEDAIRTRLSNQSLNSATTTTTTSGDVSDDSFEIVSPANIHAEQGSVRKNDAETEDTFELINNPNSPTDASSHLSSPSSTPLPPQPVKTTSHYFHIATFSAGRNYLLSKEYNEKDSGKVAITAYGNSRFDQFIAFQLSHPVPDVVSQIYTSNNNRNQAPTVLLSDQFQTVDIVIGKVSTIPNASLPLTSTGVYNTLPANCAGGQVVGSTNVISNTTPSYSSYVTYSANRVDLQSFVYRHSFVENALSNRQLYDLAKDLLIPFLNPSNPRNEKDKDNEEIFGGTINGMEYRLYITNQYGSVVKYLIPNTEERFDYKEFVADNIHNNIIAVVILPTSTGANSSFNWTKMTQCIDVNDQLKGVPIARKDTIDVYDCINKFIEREQLADTETIYCSACKEHLPPIKKMDLFSTPDILIIQLKRFQFVPGQYFIHREKINDVIDFPIEGLDLRKYVLGYPSKKNFTEENVGVKEIVAVNDHEIEGDEGNLLYDLYAVSHHMGGLGGGHYTATCKNSLNQKWYYFNDSMVTETTPESAINGTAYVLFYQRRKGNLKWGGIQPLKHGLIDEEAK